MKIGRCHKVCLLDHFVEKLVYEFMDSAIEARVWGASVTFEAKHFRKFFQTLNRHRFFHVGGKAFQMVSFSTFAFVLLLIKGLFPP